MSNVSLSISVPKELKELIMQRTRSGYFGTPSEYLRHLVRNDIARNADIREMEDFIQKGIDSGVSNHSPADIFANARQRINEE